MCVNCTTVCEVTDCSASLSFRSEAQQTLRYLICFGKANKPVCRRPLRSVATEAKLGSQISEPKQQCLNTKTT